MEINVIPNNMENIWHSCWESSWFSLTVSNSWAQVLTDWQTTFHMKHLNIQAETSKMKNSNSWNRKVFIYMITWTVLQSLMRNFLEKKKKRFLQHSSGWTHIWRAVQTCWKCVEYIQSHYNGWLSWSAFEIRYSSVCWWWIAL